MPQYSHAQLATDIQDIQAASVAGDPSVAAAAAARGRTLLRSSGVVGNLVQSRRADLERAVGNCEAALSGMSSEPPEQVG